MNDMSEIGKLKMVCPLSRDNLFHAARIYVKDDTVRGVTTVSGVGGTEY
jgi:hypothetical protein